MNSYKKSQIKNYDFVINNIYSNDDMINLKINNLIDNPYQKKINLINLILQSDIIIPFKNNYDIIKFFNWISPLNLEYNLSSKDWNYKIINYENNNKIILQNSISKTDMSTYFYTNYINLIKKILSNSNIKYYYFEFKSKRFNKIKDIIWVF